MIDEAIAPVEVKGGDARTKLRRLFAIAGSIGDLLNAELAIRDWARREKAVADRLRRVDNRRMDTCAPCSVPSATTRTTSRSAACS